ncbi:hypothetical protein PLICRDRAFT_102894 [Plicaturopsis crispa FD-325 SS-3]|nr:hypothetical protein PLICRDRAFT_102894 [Plicaturopsis crispa FD-325 SS-3]
MSGAPATAAPVPAIPLSFPAILRNPGLTDRFAHLRTSGSSAATRERPSVSVKKNKRAENEGKRWVRRKENSKFVGNPHITAASRKDYNITPPSALSTFPEPLPAYLSRNTKVPSAGTPAALDPHTANAGRFSLSLKGMRRTLRKSGPGAQALIRDVETEMVTWLREGGTWLAPGADPAAEALKFPGKEVGGNGVVREVGRTVLKLVWSISDDAFARYVVHCCARYHEVVSFSKDHEGRRLTYLLRPNVTRPDRRAQASLDTPPPTDLSESDPAYSSDALSEDDLVSAMGDDTLSAIDEQASLPPSSPRVHAHAGSDDAWSIVGDSDADESEHEAAPLPVDAATASADVPTAEQTADVDATPRPLRHRDTLRTWARDRAQSSPSRSPARRAPRRKPRAERTIVVNPDTSGEPKSFYEYLFS